MDDSGAATTASVEETVVNPSPTTRTPGSGARGVSEGTEKGATAEDAAAKEAVAREASAKLVATEHAATGAVTKEAATEAAEDATAAAGERRSCVAARGG